jgi:hypothetical protein
MKKILIAVVILQAIACNQDSSKSEPISVEGFQITVDSTKGSLDLAGPDVDLMKKLLSSVEKADWEAARACFADSAVIFYNQWPLDTTQKGAPVSEVLAFEKADRVNWENVSYGEPIVEVVTTASGEKYGHIWARYTAKNKKTGKSVDVPLFASYLISDDKLQWESAIYDTKKLE